MTHSARTFGTHVAAPPAPRSHRTFAGAAAAPGSDIPDTYDQIFTRVAMGIPIQLLKATAWEESRFKPAIHPPKPGGGVYENITGLGQITPGALKTFNAMNHYSFTNKDMEDPEKNAMVISWLYKFIVDEFAKQTQTFKAPDWDDPNYVGALLLAYGAGSGDKHGVVNLLKAMEKAEIPRSQMTPEGIREIAMKTYPALQIYNDGRGYMSDPALLKNVNKKLQDYFGLRGKPVPTVAAAAPAPSTSFMGPPVSAMNAPAPAGKHELSIGKILFGLGAAYAVKRLFFTSRADKALAGVAKARAALAEVR